MSAAIATYAKLGIDTANPVTKAFQFARERLVATPSLLDLNALRGKRGRDGALVRNGNITVGGSLSLQPGPTELSLLLPWIMGGTPTGSGLVTYPLAEQIGTRYVTIDRIANVFTYAGCGIDKATFKATRGGSLNLDLDIVGQTRTIAASGTFPAGLTLNTDDPFLLSDATISVGGTSVQVSDFDFSFSNHIDRGRFLSGSLTLTAINALDRTVESTLKMPYGDYQAIWAAGGAAGATYSATFTNGTSQLIFNVNQIIWPEIDPNADGREEIYFDIEGGIFQSPAGTYEVNVQLHL